MVVGFESLEHFMVAEGCGGMLSSGQLAVLKIPWMNLDVHFVCIYFLDGLMSSTDQLDLPDPSFISRVG